MHDDEELVIDDDQSTLNIQDVSGCTPIYYAAQNGRHKIVSIIIVRDADFRLQTNITHTAGYIAAGRGHLEVLKGLVENGMGADEGPLLMSRMEIGDKRPIHYAAQGGLTEVVKFLLEKGADPTRGTGTICKFLPSNNTHGLAKKAGYEELMRILAMAIKEWKRSY